MNLALIQIGKTKDRWLQEGIDEYLKRLSPYHKIKVIELADASLKTSADATAVRAKEAELVWKQLEPQDYLVALDEAGRLKSSLEFSQFLANLSDRKRVVFLIGGVYGLDSLLKAGADELLSLSPLTFTHRMARLILVEQIYRATMIAQGRSYHV